MIDALLTKNPVTGEGGEEHKDEVSKERGVYSTKIETKHLKSLLYAICEKANIELDSLMDFELSFYDTTPGELVGIHQEFISCARQDNLIGSMTGAFAMETFSRQIPNDNTVNMLICYDHEENGSISYQGAGGTFTGDIIERVFNKFIDNDKTITSDGDKLERLKVCMKKSFYMSTDQNHAQHPNYAWIQQENHTPTV